MREGKGTYNNNKRIKICGFAYILDKGEEGGDYYCTCSFTKFFEFNKFFNFIAYNVL